MEVITQTRAQRVGKIVQQPAPVCASIQYNHEHFKILAMLKQIVACTSMDVQKVFLMNLLGEALQHLQALDDISSTPTDYSSRNDSIRWTEVSIRMVIAETMWEAGQSVSFHDCYDAIGAGRSRLAQLRLCEQLRNAWEQITGADTETDFRFP